MENLKYFLQLVENLSLINKLGEKEIEDIVNFQYEINNKTHNLSIMYRNGRHGEDFKIHSSPIIMFEEYPSREKLFNKIKRNTYRKYIQMTYNRRTDSMSFTITNKHEFEKVLSYLL